MATGYAWFLVLGSVFLCNLMKTLLPTISSFVSRGCCNDMWSVCFRRRGLHRCVAIAVSLHATGDETAVD